MYSADLTKTVTGVSLVAGQVSAVTATLRGGAESILFEISVSSWGAGTIALGTTGPEIPKVVGTFGGLHIAPAPLYFDGYNFMIKDDDWNHESYGVAHGFVEGSYYFSWYQLGQFFDSEGSDIYALSRDIDNAHPISYGGYDDWKIASIGELETIIATSTDVRPGSNVNGVSGMHWALVRLTGIDCGVTSTPYGLLIFPDSRIITGRPLDGMDTEAVVTSGVTNEEIDEYLSQGCAFFPCFGMYNANSGVFSSTSGNHVSATLKTSSSVYSLFIANQRCRTSSAAKNAEYIVRLVREAS